MPTIVEATSSRFERGETPRLLRRWQEFAKIFGHALALVRGPGNVATQELIMHTLTLGADVSLDLLTERDEFLGIGGVRIGALAMRSPRRPMFVEICSPDAVKLVGYQLRSRTGGRDGTELVFAASALPVGKMEWQLHEARYRYNTSDWSVGPTPRPDTELRLVLKPVARRMGRYALSGFSYQYHYRSDSLGIYQILDRSTWEVGASAVGNEIWMRQGAAPNIVAITHPQQHYATEWYLPSAVNPNIFQFHPLQTQLQGFTMTAHQAGVLITMPTAVSHLRTLLEKRRDSQEIAHWHEHCGDLAREFSSNPVEVLWTPGEFDFVERANLWQAVFDHVCEALHQQIGMRRERVTSYAEIEEWTNADMADYAGRGLPKLAAAGVKTVFLANHFRNNMNTYGIGNMCCTVDLKVAETVGEDALQTFCRQAAAADMAVEMWGNTALSTFGLKMHDRNGRPERIDFLPYEGSAAEALATAQRPYVRTTANHIDCDHYSPTFAVMNLRDPVVRQYWLTSWKYAHDQVGLRGIFLDSSFNLSSDKFHYEQNSTGVGGATMDQLDLLKHSRPERELPQLIWSQYRAHLELMVEMQRMGYGYCGEDCGCFGTHRAGTTLENRLAALPLWSEGLANFDPAAIRDLGHDPAEVFFRGLAYRTMWTIFWHPASDSVCFLNAAPRHDEDVPSAWQLALLRIFDEVSPSMFQRRILPEQMAVLYRGRGPTEKTVVLWSFGDLRVQWQRPVRGRDMLVNKSAEALEFTAERHRVYEFENVPADEWPIVIPSPQAR